MVRLASLGIVKNFLHLLECAAPVGDCVLLVRRQVGERLVVSVRNEQRVVAESLRARRLKGDTAEALPDRRVLASLRVDKRHRAREVRAAVFDAPEVLQEKRVVGRRVARLARIARAAHARSAAEGADLESRVVGHAPRSGVLRGYRAHLDEGVADEVRRVLLDALGVVGDDLEAGQDLRYLADLVGVVRGDE